MAIAFVNRVQAGQASASANIVSPSQSVTTGNLLVVLVQWQLQVFSSISDTAGNSWTQAGTELSAGSNRFRLYYAWNCVGHATNVVTVALVLGAGYNAIVVQQFSGVKADGDPLDDVDSATGNSTSPATPSLTVSASEDVICAFMECDADTVTGGTGYTLTNFAVTGDAVKYFADEYHVVTASEAATATCASGSWYIKAAAFKTAAAAAGQPTMRRWAGVPFLGGHRNSGRSW